MITQTKNKQPLVYKLNISQDELTKIDLVAHEQLLRMQRDF